MPKRNDIKTILLIGSGPIIIGQACEFDYSGTQAVKTLKNLGYRVVLINSNPATIMTDPEFADKTYIEPITEESIAQIIALEKVDAILPTMGGQTALNVAMSMFEKGMLGNVEFLGAKPEAIKKGEDRQIFKEVMLKIGMDLPKSFYAYNEAEALEAAQKIGFPLIIRASFTLAGGGSGVAYNIDEFKVLAKAGLEESPIHEILIEESLLGWKEYEMEVIRDKEDNCIIVCSIENLDPMGVHTGDSITIAPALTLTDKEYQRMRDASFAILREIGVDTGGSNVQFAIHPQTGRMIVIEMNPRVSRSSALASKATGYPIAKVATLLTVGFSLDEIKNDMTGMPASFEPSIDYIVTKIPRFTFEKFPNVSTTLTTSMKSIGEVMAIGANFYQSIQKALCSLEVGLCGFDSKSTNLDLIKKEIRRANEDRILYIADGFRMGLSVEEMHTLSSIDPWFLQKIYEIVEFEKNIRVEILIDKNLMLKAKKLGFSDRMIAKMLNCNEELEISENEVTHKRLAMDVRCVYEEVDTCAAEFTSLTPYYYSSFYDSALQIQEPKEEGKKVLIIGGGPNRIGQGIEFDYACVHASFALADMGIKSIMYNCNPETVSTDYDTSDALYFEPISFEFVRSVLEREKPDGVIVHFGGQTPLKLANELTKFGAKIIGTSARVIDIAENREKFSNFVKSHNLRQPENGIANSREDAYRIARNLGYPVLVRPSYVLGGRAMRIVGDESELESYMDEVLKVSTDSPILIDRFLDSATELDVDCICDGRDVYIGGVMQHVEEAGIHSGDSASVLPTISIEEEMLKEIKQTTALIARELGVVGLMNVQYAICNGLLYIVEVNPRASRTVPFVSKATGMPLAKVATRVMWQGNLKEALEFYAMFCKVVCQDGIYESKGQNHIAIKESVFPFNKLGAEIVLGPEMRSSGEVMGISENLGVSFAKSQIACKNTLPNSGLVFLSLCDKHKCYAPELARGFLDQGFSICATSGTYEALESLDIPAQKVFKVSEARPNIVDMMTNGEISLAINTSDNKSSKEDTRLIRMQVLRNSIPYFTTIEEARVAILALESMKTQDVYVPRALQNFLA